ncbi:MAG: DEAD/DEAH box helicase [Deltaproteobacteria bacterium]|nr:DEAD/DEAH box helicase [Deltaproteobacteria bacterium]
MTLTKTGFHPIIREWFSETFGSPTDVQEKAWPFIASGKHLLITAPTGSGKTLAAFLWAIHRLVSNDWPPGQIRAIYISPLKALNNDVRRNLITPLRQLKARFQAKGEIFPDIRVATRSGDTPADERRRMLRTPPEILITTPESLNILVSSKGSRKMLEGVAVVILDEVHAVAGGKRGVHLMMAVDRLVPLSGEFQRIALSATVKPMERIAEFIGGYRMQGDVDEPVYQKRPVTLIQSDMQKEMTLRVDFPADAGERMVDDSRWPALIESFKEIIHKNRSTLLFTNSRRMAEKVARLINEGEPEELAYSHHGSLSKELRLVVEQKLKRGELKAIVATNSLELGIDIGDLEQVVLIQTPPAISSAIQRIGRSGHGVGEESRGILFPIHGRDFINAAVLAPAVMKRDMETIEPVECPLDVLAQIILAMTGVETWHMDGLFAFLKTNASFHPLTRKQFDLVLEMLAGRYAGTRLRELKPRVSLDRIDNTVRAKSGVLMLVYMAGGTIPDRGYFNLRIRESRARIGELDEEFVWERHVGETFAFGPQTWRILKITHNDVEVAPVERRPGIIPFWRAEARNRDFHFSEKIGLFLETANEQLERSETGFREHLLNDRYMSPVAATELIGFLKLQRRMTEADLPHRHHLLIEHFEDPLNKADSKQVILHTLWGGRINRPFAMALSAAWEKQYHTALEAFVDDDCIVLLLPHALDVHEILDLVDADNVERLLRECLERNGYFGARFRENAGRALLLPRAGFKKRMPLWLNRLRAKKLMDAVLNFRDFPILLETWRACLKDDFDLEHLKQIMDELHQGKIRIGECRTTQASVFAGSVIWQQTNTHMYEDDSPAGGKRSGLSDDLIREIMGTKTSQPLFSPELILDLTRKLQRTAPGYAPSTPGDLLDWVKERVFLSRDEWHELLQSMERDHGIAEPDAVKTIEHKLAWFKIPGAGGDSVCSLELLPRLCGAFSFSHPQYESPAKDLSIEEREVNAYNLLGQWLSIYGPVPEKWILSILGGTNEAEQALLTLMELERIIKGKFTTGTIDDEICDRENFEILLRLARRARQPQIPVRPADDLQLFLAAFQHVTKPGDTLESLQDSMEQLFGLCEPAGAWEEFILPARISPYYPSWLDSLMQSSELTWFGGGKEKLGFAFHSDLDLFKAQKTGKREPIADLFPDKRGRYGLLALSRHCAWDVRETARRLWEAAWRGRVSNDTFAVVRSGILSGFIPREVNDTRSRSRLGSFNRWKSPSAPVGNWYLLEQETDGEDPVAQTEIEKDRVRQLFRRYGILFRQLLTRELPLLRWDKLFRVLRLMELSGEITSGCFFKGISGPQFISFEALRFLRKPPSDDIVFWVNATDPASLCGIKPEGLTRPLPSRIPSTHLVFHGNRLVLVSKGNHKRLEIHEPPDSIHLRRYYQLFKDLVNRAFNPVRSIRIEEINNRKATDSPYGASLKAFGFSSDYKGFELRRSF